MKKVLFTLLLGFLGFVDAFASSEITIFSSSPSICSGQTVTFTSSVSVIPDSYQWYKNGSPISGETNSSYITNTLSNNDIISCELIDNSSTSWMSNDITITVNSNPSSIITPSGSTTFCEGGNVTLEANAGAGLTYQWQLNGNNLSGSTNQSIIVNTSGDYTVVVTNSNSCSSTSASTTITVNPNPTATITPSGSTTFCEGGNVTLEANAGAGLTYQWQLNGNNLSDSTNQSIIVNTSGDYTVVVTNSNSCSSTSASTTITVNPNPTATITPSGSTTFCEGGNVTLEANAGAGLTYQWQLNGNNLSDSTNQSIIVNTSGDYTVVVTNSNSCSSTSASTTITVNPNPTATITPSGSTTFCEGGNVTLEANAGAGLTYQWQLNGNNLSDSTNQSIIVNTSGDYTVVVTNSNSCSSTSASTTITVNPNPTATITPSGSTTFCEGGNVTLEANAGAGLTYQWQLNGNNLSDSTNQSIIVNTSGDYTVVVTNSNSCSSTSASTTITVNPNPTATITPSGSTTFCEGGNVTLEANAGDGLTYQWQLNGNNLSDSTNQSIIVNTSGDYTVVVTNSNSCSSTSASTTITVNPNPTATITPSGSTTFCEGGNVTLEANAGDGLTYQWQLNGNNLSDSTNQSIIVNTSGDYTVVVTNSNSCSSTSASTTITVNPNPTATITPSGSTTFCEGGNVTLEANAGDGLTYQWQLNGNNLSDSTNQSIIVNTSGDYTVVVTNSNSCSSTSASTTITVNPNPTATITPSGSTTFCEGGNVTLEANAGDGLTYQWQLNGNNLSDSTNQSIIVNTSGDYTVVVTNSNSCSSTSASTTITVNPNPTATITPSGSTTFCEGGNVTLEANAGDGLTYQWQLDGSDLTDSTDQIITVDASGDYTVVVTNSNSCSSTSASTTITVNPNPTATITPSGSTTFCEGGNVTLEANAGDGLTYQWQLNGNNLSDSTNQSIIVNTSGDYTVVVTNSNSCSSTSASTTITVNPNPTATITPSGSTTFCEGGNVTLEANAGDGLTYQWQLNGNNLSDSTNQSIIVNTSGDYTVVVTNSNSCSSTSASTTITVNPNPTATITPSGSTTFCEGGNVTLEANAGDGLTYQWQLNGNNLSDSTNQSIIVNTSGDYTVVVTNSNSCSSTSASTTITVNPNPTATITPSGSTTFCEGGNVTLEANAGDGLTYQWQLDGSDLTDSTDQIITVDASGDYTVVVTNSNSCSSTSASTTITVNPNPTATITPSGSTTFCEGGNVTLEANAGAGLTYQWQLNGNNLSDSTNQSIIVNASGDYTVVVTNSNSCSSTSASTTITVNPNPTATITPSGSTTFCEGGNVTLEANAGDGLTYQWQLDGSDLTDSTDQIITVDASGDYTVVVTNSNSCSSTSASTTITVNPNPTATITPSGSTTFCEGGNVTLEANAGDGLTYQWQLNGNNLSDSTNQSIIVNTSGDYTVVVTNSNSCSSTSASTTITVNPNPTATITPSGSTTFCEGGNVTLEANAGDGLTYQWQLDGSDLTDSTDQIITVDASGDYTVVVTNSNSCSSTSASTTITVNPNPTATITPSGSTTFCEGGNVTLEANAGAGLTYQWQLDGSDLTDSTDQIITVDASGDYTVVVTNSNSCSSTSASTTITVNPNPTATITPSGSTTFCEGGNVTLEANAGDGLTYQWQLDGSDLTDSTDQIITVDASGDYTVVVTNSNSCSSTSASTTITVNPNPTATITPSGSTTFCEGGNVTLEANAGAGLTYQWQLDGSDLTDSTDQIITVDASGDYTVVVTNSNSCSSTSASTTITVNPNPTATITPSGSTTFCEGGNVTLEANAGDGLTYQWQLDGSDLTDSTDQIITVDASGDYTVVVTNSNSCSSTSASTTITVNPNPTATITPSGSTTFCEGGNVTLEANAGDGLTYQWQLDGSDLTDSTDQIITVDASGDYTVVVTNSNSCSSTSASTTITVNPNPTATITPSGSTTFCEGGNVTLEANAGDGLTYQWQLDGSDIPGATEENYTSSIGGDFSVWITNENSCFSNSNVVTITVNPNPIAIIPTDLTVCNDGTIEIVSSVSGGSMPYSYQWSGPDSYDGTSQDVNINNATTTDNEGDYTLIVTDDNNCTSLSVLTTVSVLSPINITVTPDATYCFASSINLEASAIGGTGNFVSYNWSGPNSSTFTGGNIQVTNNATNSDEGAYEVIVTDDLGCMASIVSNVLVGNEIIANAGLNASVCFDATIQLNGSASGGSGLYEEYTWTGPLSYVSSDQNSSIDNVTTANGGEYSLIVKDDAGCYSSPSIVNIIVTTPVVVDVTNNSLYCNGANITLNANASGGTSPYSYTWTNDNQDTIINGEIIGATNVNDGLYTVTVFDDLGCQSNGIISLSISDPIVAFAGEDSIRCYGTPINLYAMAIGGSGNFTNYYWTGPNGFNVNAISTNVTNIATSLQTGTYVLEVTDDIGCVSAPSSITFTVNDPILTTVNDDSTYCYGSTFNLAVDAIGGTGVYSYSWTTPDNSTLTEQNPEIQDATLNESGKYYVVVTDDANCTSLIDSVTATINPMIILDAGNDITSCFNSPVQLNANVSGGTSPYNLVWTNIDEDLVSSGLINNATDNESGDYTVTVTDNIGCTATDVVNLNVLAPIVLTASNDTVYCDGATINLEASATGGSGVFDASSYLWIGPGFTSNSQNPSLLNANSLNSGDYKVVATDDFGCISDTSIVGINIYDPLLVTTSNNASCFGSDVTLSYTLTGGNGDLSWLWSTPNGGSIIDEIPVLIGATTADNGDYSLVITDENGCQSNESVTTVTVSDEITIVVSNDASCLGTQLTLNSTISGGVAPYQTFWTNADGDTILNGIISSPTIDNGGDYNLEVYDANGCSSTDNITTVEFFATPTSEASSFDVTQIGSDSLYISFERGDGDGVIVLMSEEAPSSTLPSCGAIYNEQNNTQLNFNDVGFSTLGNAKVIYNSKQTDATVELAIGGLNFDTHYYFTVYEYDSSNRGTSYLISPNLEGDAATSFKPTVTASNIKLENVGNTSATIKWSNGNGLSRIVVLQKNDTLLSSALPVDGTDYNPNMVLGQGDSLGQGLYVIYKGTDSVLNITGLDPFGLYTVGIFEYNQRSGDLKYGDTAALGFRTSAMIASNVNKYNFQVKYTNPSSERGVLVLVKMGSPIASMPTNGVEYFASTNKNVYFDTLNTPKIGDAYAIFRSRNRQALTNPNHYILNMYDLVVDTRYYFEVYEWDTLTNNYTYRPELQFDVKTLLGSPNTASKNMRYDNVTPTSCTIKWSNGNGSGRMLIVKEKIGNSSLNANPTDSVSYVANSIYLQGDTVGITNGSTFTGKHYVVYNGTDSSVTITGLSPLTTYNFGIIEYNGNPGFENYRLTYPSLTLTTQGIRISNVQTKKMTISFAHSSGKGGFVMIKEGAPIITHPISGISYVGPTYLTQPSTPFSISFNKPVDSMAQIDGAKVVYKNPIANPNAKTFTIIDLKPSVRYYIAAYEWDSISGNYNLTNYVASDTITDLTNPTSVAKNLTISELSSSSMKVSWSNGNGSRRIVVVKSGATINGMPQNNTTYIANSQFGLSDTLPLPSNPKNTAKNYVVYNGTDSSVVVTGLISNSQYFVRVFEYNGTNPNQYGVGSSIVSAKTTADFINLKKEGITYSQYFDSIGINGGLPEGWQSTDVTVDANSGSQGTSGVYHFGGGDYPEEDRSLGIIGNHQIGVKLRNGTAKTITSLMIRYKGIQWRRGGSSTPSNLDTLAVQYSTDAYSLTDPNIYLSSTPATWVNATNNTWLNNDNINFMSLQTGTGAASLNVANQLPSQVRGASITGLSLATGQTIFIRFNNLGGHGDALAIDSIEIIPFSNTIVGGGIVSSSALSDLNIVGGTVVQSQNSVTISNAMNIENGTTYNMVDATARSLKLNGRLYSNNELGNGQFATGPLSSINVANSIIEYKLYFDNTNNYIRNIVLSGGASAQIMNSLNIASGAQFGTVTVGTSNASSTLISNGNLTIKSDSLGSGSISPIFGSIIGDVNIERAMTYKSGNRFMGHPFADNIDLAQVNVTAPLDFSGPTQNIWYFDGSVTNVSTATALLTNASWRDYMSLSDNWNNQTVVRYNKGIGANTISLTGAINQGTQTVILNGNAGSLMLVGNPYPSGVKMANVLNSATGIGDTVWIYNVNNNTFKSYTASNWHSANLPMFGVIAVRMTGSSASLVFNESNKSATPSANTFFRPEGADEDSNDESNQQNGVNNSVSTLSFTMAPNPADDLVTIRINGQNEDNKAQIRITSMTGQVVLTSEIPSVEHSQITIPLNTLSKGMYVVELVVGDQKISQQLIKL